jgi:hypothetical protein
MEHPNASSSDWRPDGSRTQPKRVETAIFLESTVHLGDLSSAALLDHRRSVNGFDFAMSSFKSAHDFKRGDKAGI